MPTAASQPSLFSDTAEMEAVVAAVREVLAGRAQPSAWELLDALERKLGLKSRWAVGDAMRQLISDTTLTWAQRQYLTSLVESDDWTKATRGEAGDRPARDVESTVDALMRESAAYRNSGAFQEMVGFMADFRDYAPFNNMLVKLQNPSCSFFATQRDWERRFGRHLKEDARPMLILAPMHPVMLVYDLDSTDGKTLPKELLQFARFEGEWDAKRLARTMENASVHDLIRIDKVRLSSTNAGFATISAGQGGMKMRIGLHEELDEPSRYGVLLHELAHIYLGHLGGDRDGWWPCRGDLARRAMEVEAEAVAHIVSRRAGLQGASSHYVSRYLDGEATLKAISLDLIGKVAGRLESMGTSTLGKRRPRRGGKSEQQAKEVGS
jgi:hypothetical protein